MRYSSEWKCRIGPRMRDVAKYVTANPGLTMIHAARYVGPNRSLKYGYATVNRALKAGLIRKEKGPRNYWLLFPN